MVVSVVAVVCVVAVVALVCVVIVVGVKKMKLILFKLDSVRSGCRISRAWGSCIKRSSIPDRIGI